MDRVRRVKFFVDRVSEGIAVLIPHTPDVLANETLVSVSLLPEGVAEGDWLDVAFELDCETKRRFQEEIDNIMVELGDDP